VGVQAVGFLAFLISAVELPTRRALLSLKSNDLAAAPWLFTPLICKGLHTYPTGGTCVDRVVKRIVSAF